MAGGGVGGISAVFTPSFIPSAEKSRLPRLTISQPFFRPGVDGPSTSTAGDLPFRSHRYTRGLRSAAGGAGFLGSAFGASSVK